MRKPTEIVTKRGTTTIYPLGSAKPVNEYVAFCQLALAIGFTRCEQIIRRVIKVQRNSTYGKIGRPQNVRPVANIPIRSGSTLGDPVPDGNYEQAFMCLLDGFCPWCHHRLINVSIAKIGEPSELSWCCIEGCNP